MRYFGTKSIVKLNPHTLSSEFLECFLNPNTLVIQCEKTSRKFVENACSKYYDQINGKIASEIGRNRLLPAREQSSLLIRFWQKIGKLE